MKNWAEIVIPICLLFFLITPVFGQEFEAENLYPWCIVAYDSLDRTPQQRIDMIKEIGFEKYAYDWLDEDLDEAYEELQLAQENDIEIIAVWLWLNTKRDDPPRLSPSNQKIFQIVDSLDLETTFWLSFNQNFFEGLNQDVALEKAVKMVEVIADKARKQNCELALYNHSGWFGDPLNQLEIIKALPHYNMSLVYNFHHAHKHIEEFSGLVKIITPYLSAVNVNGMLPGGEKILTIGQGSYEKIMINLLIDSGFTGPWGILGHRADEDAEKVLRQNLKGLKSL